MATRDGLTGDLAGARPDIDRLKMEETRERTERALFGSAAPARLGRFVLLKPLAGGGMGMIHRGYDPQLERRVALKVLQPQLLGTERARQRLITEARVLAQLSHPNIVPVYEVVEVDDQVVIVMELVEGRTLADWQQAGQRTWREIVAVYLQAGRGLDAAHELGIVHRDFKPTNAIVGDDGRVRVLDFGVASLEATIDSEVGERDQPPSAVSASLTATGELLGTLAFMAPEQLRGERATAVSDQFGFCVALHHALYGAPPFAGTSAPTLLAAIEAGWSPAARRVPSWLRSAIARGLAFAPEHRHASMRALLAQLERGSARRRWWIIAAAAPIVSGVIVASALRHNADARVDCDSGGAAVQRVWNPNRAQEIRAALANVGTAYAKVSELQIIKSLDAYGRRWSLAHSEACREHRDRPDDPAVAARFLQKRQCLDRRIQDLANAVDVLAATDKDTVLKAVDVAARLPPVEPCADADSLPEEADPPVSPQLSIQIASIRATLSRAATLERAGRSTEALQLVARALEDAQRTGFGPAIVEAQLAKGTFLVFRYDFAAAIEPLRTAERLAYEQHQFHAAVIASARRIYAESMEGIGADTLVGTAQTLEMFSKGLRVDHFAQPLLLNYVGVLHMTRGEQEQARQHFEAAQQMLAPVRSVDLELNDIYMNLAMLTPSAGERNRLASTAWRRYVDELGPNHLTALSAEFRYARYSSDPSVGLRLLRDANKSYRAYHPDRLADRSLSLLSEAFLASELETPERAIAVYQEVVDLASGTTDDDVQWRGRLAAGYTRLYRSDATAALEHFNAVIAKYEQSPHWWEHQSAGYGHLGAALAEEALASTDASARATHLARAGAHYERCASLLAEIVSRNEDVEPRQQLARAWTGLARVLRSRGINSALATDLETRARTFYEDASVDAYRRQLDELPRRSQ